MKKLSQHGRVAGAALEFVYQWYKGMVNPDTGMLEYLYIPEDEDFVREKSPIRDIASVWDVEILSDFLNRHELRPLVKKSLQHYGDYLVERDDYLILDPNRHCICMGLERGGFGLTLENRMQRIDITGHAASAFMKSLGNGIEAH